MNRKGWLAVVVVVAILLTPEDARLQTLPRIVFDHTHTFAETAAYLTAVSKAYSEITRLHTIGKSFLGKDLLVLEELAARRVYVVPTISLFESFNSFDDQPERFDDPVLKATLPDFLWQNMRRPDYMAVEKKRFAEVARMDAYRWAEKAVPIFKANTLKMHRAGVKIAVGTDAGGTVGYNFQGYNTPREIELLVESGLTPMEALVAATRTGAEVIGVQEMLGTIEVGKLADLLILSADPLVDIRNLRRIDAVVQNGVLCPRQAFAYAR